MKISTNLLNDLFSNGENIIGIIGENGIGKTTFAKYIAGFLYKEKEIINNVSNVALILQNPYQQFVGRTTFDEITYLLEQNKVNKKEINEILQSYEYDLEKDLIKLSGGEAQELLVNNFLISNKEIIICDENFSNLDSKKKYKLFNKIKKSNKKIILITNNIYDLKYCDKVYELGKEELFLRDVKIENTKFFENDLEEKLFLKNVYNHKIKNKQTISFKYGINLLVGESGIGKSSIFEILCSFDDYKGIIENPLKGVFIVSQYPSEQITTTKVKEEFEVNEELKKLLEDFGFDKDILNRDIVELSTGELTQLLLIKALLSNKELILLDESFEVLDLKKQKIVLNKIENIKNKVIICITHNKEIFTNRKVNIVEVK